MILMIMVNKQVKITHGYILDDLKEKNQKYLNV